MPAVSASPEAQNVLLTVSYDGTLFHGWAEQPGQRTVAGELGKALGAMVGHPVHLFGVSRTDAGVHARAQRVSFRADRDIPLKGWVLGLNQRLPDDLAVRKSVFAPPGYNPRFDSLEKTYVYRLLADRVRDPHRRCVAWRVGDHLDVALLRREASRMLGTHDFRAFRSSADTRENTSRTIRAADIVEKDDGEVAICVSGTAFMHNMVRILVGTLVDVASGRIVPGAIGRALSSGRRDDAGRTAPAHGLTLESVKLGHDALDAESWPP